MKKFLLFLLCASFCEHSSIAQWVKKANALKRRSEVTSVVYSGKLYTFLGFSDTLLNPEPSAEVYDPVADKWSILTGLPSDKTVTHQGVVLVDDKVWMIGGRQGKDPGPLTAEIWIYNITSNTWSQGPNIKDPATGEDVRWGGGGSGMLGRTIHLFGGFVNTACNGDQGKYHLTLNVDDWMANPLQPAPWKNELALLPVNRNHIGTVVLGGKIYAIGGQLGHDCDGGFDRQFCHVYNPVNDTWTELPKLPTPRSHAEGSVFSSDGKIYIVAGQGQGGVNTNKVTLFDPAANNGEGSWTENVSLELPTNYEGVSSKIIGTHLFFTHGGEGSSRKTRNTTYSRTIARSPLYELRFPPEPAVLQSFVNGSVKGKTLLFTMEASKTYSISSNASWLKVTGGGGSAGTNGVVIEFTANAAGLAPGSYTGVLKASGTGSGQIYKAGTYLVNYTVEAASPALTVNAEYIYSGVRELAGETKQILLSNSGSASLVISSVNITGSNAGAFTIKALPALPLSIPAGEVYALDIQFTPPRTPVGYLNALLNIASNDKNKPSASVGLFGLSTVGEQGNKEPPFDAVVKTLGYAINVGGKTLILSTDTFAIGDEVLTPLFVKAGPGPVTMKAVARYSPDDLLSFGYYIKENGVPAIREIGKIDLNQEQTLLPAITAGSATTFNPGADIFGFFTGPTSYAKQNTYTEDKFNTGPLKHSARIYPLKDRQGVVKPDTYLIGFEPAVNGDYQDYVFEISNIKPATGSNNDATIVRLNAGGPAISVNAVKWDGCPSSGSCNTYVTGGYAYRPENPGQISGAVSPVSAEIMSTQWAGGETGAGTVPAGQTAFTYTIPVRDGTYLVRLHFAELVRTNPGYRRFDVNIEGGDKELNNFDIIMEAGGKDIAIYRDFPVTVNDGNITIDFIHQMDNAVINAIEITPYSPLVITPTGLLEGEAALLGGGTIINANRPGYTGTGFADIVNNSNDFIEWTINKSSAGDASLIFRYSNGGTTNRPLQLKVNGQVTGNIAFPSTGSWGTWGSTGKTIVALSAGINTIRLTTTGANGGNIDHLDWAELTNAPDTTAQGILEAEQATLSQVKIESNRSGFTGQGFADFINTSNDYVEWKISTTDATMASLGFRYANGTTDRPLKLEVNGEIVADALGFASTGSWTAWKYIYDTVALRAGLNTIRITAIGYSGGNFDHLKWEKIQAGSTSGILEAESASLYQVKIDKNRAGYTGTGFADYINNSGDYVEWTINSTQAAAFNLQFRYANGSGADRPLQLQVNEAIINTALSFPSTVSWTQWMYASASANLVAGPNKIRLTAAGLNGANIDHLRWETAGSASVSSPSRLLVEEVNPSIAVISGSSSRHTRVQLKGLAASSVNITVTDISGRIYRRIFYEGGASDYSFDIPGGTLRSGTYLITVQNRGKNYSSKLFIVH